MSGRPRSFEKREVLRLAEKGVELEGIIATLDIPKGVAEARGPELTELVRVGHAKFRASIAVRAHSEGVKKGRSNTLLALGRKYLGYDTPKPEQTLEERWHASIASSTRNLTALLARLYANRVAADPSLSYSAHCPSCEERLLCQPCAADPERRRVPVFTAEEVSDEATE
jgi:hypothetical protein